MAKPVSIGMSAAAAAVFTHGVVLSAVHFDEFLPISTYRGFFLRIAVLTERLWSYAHGWQPGSHIRDFGHFYAPMVQLIGPLTGFALFWMTSRHKVGTEIWKPLAVAFLLAIPTGYLDLVPGNVVAWVEATRTVFIVLLMVWCVGGFRSPLRHTSTDSVEAA